MIRELTTLLAVARYGTFAAAGQQIGLTQSAVSAQIRTLEQAVGQTLFDRTGRSASLNAAGLRALPLANEIIATYQQLCRPEQGELLRGTVTLGAITSVLSGLMPAVLLALRQQAPQLEMKLSPGMSLNLLTAVEAGALDLAVLVKPPFPLNKDLFAQTLQRQAFVLICPPDTADAHPLNILRSQPFIRYNRSSFDGRLVQQYLRQQQINVEVALELDELDAIVKMVEVGLGVSLIPSAGLWLERNSPVRIMPLGDATFYREVIMVIRQSQRQLPLLQQVQRCLQMAKAS